MKRIVILGASGQIGNVLMREFSRYPDYEIIGTSRSGKGELLKFDPFLDNWDRLGKADVLINCVGMISETKNFSFYKVHVALAELIITNRNRIGNPRIIQVSALGASLHHNVSFLQTKGKADELLLSAPDTFIIRPSIVCTPGTMLAEKFLMLRKISKWTLGFLLLPKGFLSCKIQPVMPDDLADVIRNLAEIENAGRILNVVGSTAISYQELLDLQFNGNARIIEFPKWVGDILITSLVAPLFPSLISQEQYKLLFTDNIADSKNMVNLLKRRPHSALDFWINEFN